ncbi:bifunctional 3-(3-hydroxy-phenyl)propionate/3-hydroxycinnamic acid hydroxylase [Actinokineospora soli]|uniref:Bifunctional 3-(3-hydroxy-phenyl)propionate/3-hydroxycinnamic acid hydroxylase n=1 Tax=Actinokineospora soli TaxID=1048753 RepID=A0ABW2TNZ3_9PSEU
MEHLLRDGLPVRDGVEVTAINQDETGVEVHFTDLTTDTPDSIRANWLLGCDGANSTVRPSIGATMTDLGFNQRWLVIDAETDTDLGRWDGVHQVCDHTRPATYMRIGDRRHRWEFRLNPQDPLPDHHALLRQWTPHPLTIIRVAEYTFRAQIADRWRDRRILLLGDAAHLTPPFIGQGLGAGIRDAANLTWKLAAVINGTLPESALDTYQSERAPHTRSLIRLATLIGQAMTGGGTKASTLRRALLPHLRLLPLALNSRTPPLRRSTLIARPRLLPTLAGTLCPNALLPNGTRFDTAAAGRWTVISSTTPSPTTRATIARRGGVLIVTRPGDALHAWLRRGRTTAALIRPDGTVARTGRSSSACLP